MATTSISDDKTNFIVTNMNIDERLFMSTLTVLATDIADFGTYRCVATNVVAVASTDMTLTIHGEYTL